MRRLGSDVNEVKFVIESSESGLVVRDKINGCFRLQERRGHFPPVLMFLYSFN